MSEKTVLLIEGYGRKNGFCSALCEKVKEAASDYRIEVFNPYLQSFVPCDGCGGCNETGKCRHRDLDGFRSQFETADIIVLVSPVYNGFFTAPSKALLDRLQGYYSLFYQKGKVQPIEKRRKLILITSAGRDGKESHEYMVKRLKLIASVTNLEFLGSVCCDNTDINPDIEKAERELTELCERVF